MAVPGSHAYDLNLLEDRISLLNSYFLRFYVSMYLEHEQGRGRGRERERERESPVDSTLDPTALRP